MTEITADRVGGDWLSAPRAQAVFAALADQGFAAYAVGGCVRNALLGAPVDDLDIATEARPEETVAAVEAAGLKAVPTGADHGTITVVSEGEGFEVTTFRADVETDGRHARVRFSKTLEEDARRRDFTINALYARPDGQVIAPLGAGQLEDLAARRVRFIGDAEARIREDYLRILRYFRFAAWYGDPAAGFDPEALAAIAAEGAGLTRLSKERVGAEMKKLLAAPDPGPALGAMAQSGALARVLPGAVTESLAPLIHLEGQAGSGPEPLRRLAALGVRADVDLRLSKAEQKHLARLWEAVENGAGPAALGYRFGEALARDALLLRAAGLGMPLDPGALSEATHGARQSFPVSARDLMPERQGPEIGAALSELEARWIASGFTLDRAALLANLRKK